jgi:murein DD-endopeptidase MepM/ murein hydrolase activator NlpD
MTDHLDPEFERNLAGVRSLLNRVSEIVSAEASNFGAEYRWLDKSNTGLWQYETDLFIHPLAIEVVGEMAYVLDAGRVLALGLQEPDEPQAILAPGDEVEGTRVLEPLDLAARGTTLLVLDRAGDVYAYDPAPGDWTLDRYDRPPGATYDHYFVALDADGDTGYLLETTHEQVWAFPPGEKGFAWVKLAQGRDVDVSASGGDVYVLTRGLNNPAGQLGRYQAGQRIAAFRPELGLLHARQVRATEPTVYVLDRAGRRLLALDSADGTLTSVSQFPDRGSVSALWASPSGERVVLAGRDRLYFVGEPDKAATIEGGPVLEGLYPHDPELLSELRVLQVPIEGASLTTRDFQMPGAPRHYRLGVHEGIDFYGHTVGVTVNRKTEVRALADGIVVRALVDYEPLTAARAEAWYATSLDSGYTPDDVLDGYRGRQLWIDYGSGVLSRYAHLGSIAPGIVEGAAVSQGQVVGTVGNSGTPGSVDSDTYDVHLHMELWIGGSPDGQSGDGHYTGQFLRPIEAREWLTRILR